MKAKIRDGWADRLDSGKYPQTTGSLRDEDVQDASGNVVEGGRCCLGVLCDYAIESELDTIKWDGEDYWVVEEHHPAVLHDCTPRCCEVGHDGRHWARVTTGMLPKVVSRWAGVDDENPVLETVEEDGCLAEKRTASALNDDHGYNFGQIAALVRALPGEEG